MLHTGGSLRGLCALAALACLIASATACGRAGGGDVDAAEAPGDAAGPGAGGADPGWPSDYFPLSHGARWTFRERAGLLGSRRVVWTAEDPRPVRGVDVPLFVVREKGDGSFLGIEDAGLLGYAVEGEFVIAFSALGEDSRGELRVFGSEGLLMLPVHPQDGQFWEQELALFSTPESRGASRQWSAQVERVSSVSVPAGRFDDAIKVEMSYRDPSLSKDRPQLSFEDYYARGVGLVKSVTRNHEGGFWRTVTRELESFEPAPGPPAPR